MSPDIVGTTSCLETGSGNNEAPRNTATKVALNRKVQVVALAMHKAFRQADMHNNIYREASGVTIIGSRTLLAGEYPRELRRSIA